MQARPSRVNPRATRHLIAALGGAHAPRLQAHMDFNTAILEVLFRGIAIGALTAMAFGLWRDGATRTLRVVGVLFCIGAAAYALNSCHALAGVLGPFVWPVRFFAMGGGAICWLFIIVLFEDRPLSPILLAPWALETVIGFSAIAALPPLRTDLWITHNIIQAGLALHALYVIARSWSGDLVEARRRLRGPLLAAVCGFAIAISVAQVAQNIGHTLWWFDLASGVALAFFSVAGAALFLRADPQLFGAAAPAPVENILPAADRAALEKLEAAMGAGEAWRREGLTIGALAEQVGVPEHRLRRLINDHLGERNFAAYVNARRVDAAKRLLLDRPADSVSAIAFDLGFASLGPFNRAFKEATGLTPSEWRKASPNP